MRFTRLLAAVGLVLSVSAGQLAVAQDTLRTQVYFRGGMTAVDPSYKKNRSSIERLSRAVAVYRAGGSVEEPFLSIRAGASPDGSMRRNQELSENRAAFLSGYLSEQLGIPRSRMEVASIGEDWERLGEYFRSSEAEWSGAALDIVEHMPIWVKDETGTIVDSRKNRLMRLEDGAVWDFLLSDVFSEVCAKAEVTLVLPSAMPQLAQPVPYAVQQAPQLGQHAPQVLIPEPQKEFQQELQPTQQRGGDTRLADYLGMSRGDVQDTLEIQFRLDSVRIDKNFAGNRARIERFVESYRQITATVDPSLLQLDIYAGASPEGPANHNRWLGQERGVSIHRLLRDSLNVKVNTVEVHNLGARWDDFYDAVAASDEPWKEEVLSIIRKEPSRDLDVRDARELELRKLHDGEVWPVLLHKYLSPLRSGGTAVLSYLPEAPVRDTVYIIKETSSRDTVYVIHEMPVAAAAVKKAPKERVLADTKPAWAVKTNLLMWGVEAPNVQVEFPLGRKNRWSLEVEYDHPWFIWNTNANASQILNLGLELRLYLGDRYYHRWLDGWHLGLAVAGGKYDWEWKQHEGWQGEFINAYFNVGYQHRFGKHWAIDAGLGLGVVPSRYRHYYGGSVYPENHLEPWDEHLIWHDTGQFLFPGPTHVNVSIVYLFNNWPVRFKTMGGRKLEKWTEERNAAFQEREMRREQKESERLSRQKAKEDAEYARDLEREAKQAAKRENKANKK